MGQKQLIFTALLLPDLLGQHLSVAWLTIPKQLPDGMKRCEGNAGTSSLLHTPQVAAPIAEERPVNRFSCTLAFTDLERVSSCVTLIPRGQNLSKHRQFLCFPG